MVYRNSGGLILSPMVTPRMGTHKTGADGQVRTDDLRITNALLCQLSYVGSRVSGIDESTDARSVL